MDWLAEVIKRQESLIDCLKQLLSIESVLDASTAGSGAPFGQGIDQALRFMLEQAEQDGFTTKNVDGYAGHIEMGNGEALIGILGHVDVVPATEGWNSDPFEPEIRDGRLYARGTNDDKGPIMAAYWAMRIVKELELPLSKRVRLILGGDEETGWRCMHHYLAREEKPTWGFTPDADFPIITAEKGFLDIQMRGVHAIESKDIQTPSWNLARFESGTRSNVVPGQADAILTGDADVFLLKEQYSTFLLENRLEGYAEEANDYVHLTLQGRSYHSSEPEKGINAGLELARFLAQVELDDEGHQWIRMIDKLFIDSLRGEKLEIQQQDERLGDLTVSVGIFRYMEGEKPYLRINIRYPNGTEVQQVMDQVQGKMEDFSFRMEEMDHKPGFSFQDDHPLVQTLLRVYEEQTGDEAEPLAIAGATYARALDGCVAFGPVFPGKEVTAHQANEYIDIEDLLRATAIYAQAIYELAK